MAAKISTTFQSQNKTIAFLLTKMLFITPLPFHITHINKLNIFNHFTAQASSDKVVAHWLTPHRLSHLSHPVVSLTSITLPWLHSHAGFVDVLHVAWLSVTL